MTTASGGVGRVYHTQQTHFIAKHVTFANGDGAVIKIGTVPAGASLVSAGTVVTTAFNAGTTNTNDIGVSGTATGISAAQALGTVGRIVGSAMATSTILNPAVDTDYTTTLHLTGTAPTTGAAVVYIEYLPNTDG